MAELRSGSGARRWSWLIPNSPLGWARLVLLFSLVLLTVGAWVLTAYQAEKMHAPMRLVAGGAGMPAMAGGDMPGMPAAGRSIAGAAAFLAIWTTMMAGMMLPAAAPMLLTFAAAQTRRQGRGAVVSSWVFAAGYLLIWAGAGLVVYVLLEASADLGPRLASLGQASGAQPVLGLALAAAGLYQFTPLKRACLGHCCSPLGFVMRHWREGRLGALWMGLLHGAYCLGCCWALFALLVTAGMTSLAWMLLLTLLVFAEKVLPAGQRIATAIGVLLLLAGALVGLGLGGS